MLPQEPPQENGTSSHSHDMELDQVDQSSGGPVAEPSAATVEPAHPPLAADAAASNPSNSKDTHETEGMPLEGNVNPVSEATPQTQTAGDTDPTRQNQVRYVPIDLDVIHSELYHGRYFTVEDFLDDIRMIVNNASLDPDPENHSKASALLNFTIIQLDQHADPVFRADCQRMAARQRERRKAAKNKAKEAAAKANKAAAEQLAVRTADAAPNTAAEQDRSSLKRTAEEQHADDPTAKRVRIEEPSEGSSKAVNHVDPTPQSAPHPDALPVPQSLASPVPLQKQQPPGRSPLSNGIVYTRDRSESPTPGAAPPPSNDNMDAEKGEDQHITEPGPDPASQAEMSDAHEEPDVQEPDPPFVVPHESLHQLHHDLEFMTGELTIDQLEQLRAALCDAIWRGRKDWDRSSLVTELKELVSEFLEECADVQAQDRIEDA